MCILSLQYTCFICYLNYSNSPRVQIWFLDSFLYLESLKKCLAIHLLGTSAVILAIWEETQHYLPFSTRTIKIPNSPSITPQMLNLEHSTSRITPLQGHCLLFPTQHLLLMQLVPPWFVSLLQPVEAQRKATSVLFTEGGWWKKKCRWVQTQEKKCWQQGAALQLAMTTIHSGPQVTVAYSIWRSVIVHLYHKRKKHTTDEHSW